MLSVDGSLPNELDVRVLIHDVSANGVLLETRAELTLGEVIEIDLPHAGVTEARVLRKSETLFGCKFLSPISNAAVSAAVLQAPPQHMAESAFGGVVEAFNSRADSEEELPYRTRLWIIVGLALASWAVVALGIALAIRWL